MRDASFTVVADVNWSVAAGEFWVVAGQEHSGKSDLLMLAAGLMSPAAGSYRLFGSDTKDFGEAELAERLRVGFVFAGRAIVQPVDDRGKRRAAAALSEKSDGRRSRARSAGAAGIDGTHAARRRDAGERRGQLAAARGAGAGADSQAGTAAARQSAGRPRRAAPAMVAAFSRPALRAATNCSAADR